MISAKMLALPSPDTSITHAWSQAVCDSTDHGSELVKMVSPITTQEHTIFCSTTESALFKISYLNTVKTHLLIQMLVYKLMISKIPIVLFY